MKLIVKESKFSGCYELFPGICGDDRGEFIKTFHQTVFSENQFETKFLEEYYSLSHKGVLRGMHFQTPPYDHTKVVYCVYGEVLDVLVDLRTGAPTYGAFEIFSLNDKSRNMLYIPPGLAHGFYVCSDKAILMYKVTTMYQAEHDMGILWNSLGIPWPDENPIISKRDSEFPVFTDFNSPFK